MAHIATAIHDALSSAKDNAHDLPTIMKSLAEEKMHDIPENDIVVKFIGASNLSRARVIGPTDPYFIAKIDGQVSFTSSVQTNTLSPVWNEEWRVNNVPAYATIHVEVMDKDDASVVDHKIGIFDTGISSGAKEVEISGALLHKTRGTFWLTITTTPSVMPKSHPYTFDGPVRYSRHLSPLVGLLTQINDKRLYSTWKLTLKGVPTFFGDKTQHWNRDYHAAQTIFNPGAAALAVRSSIQAAHHMLYARSTTNGFGVIDSAHDAFALWRGGKTARGNLNGDRVKPAVYTYVVAAHDGTLRFSETGAAFFVDFASKHALHANCAEAVRYSGEFHPRPVGGWGAFSDETKDEEVEWEFVLDNNSGTYAPDKALLPALRGLMEYNFPWFKMVALDREDPELKKSVEECRAYAVKNRGVGTSELQPHTQQPGEETLSHRASAKSKSQAGGASTDPPAAA